MDNNRKTAYLILMDVEEKKAYSNLALNHRISYIRPDSPGFVRELVYGVLENKLYLDYIIGRFTKSPVEKTRRSDLVVLRMGVYQLMFMNSVPSYAAVDESVQLGKRYCKGREGFINGVLRSIDREGASVEMPDREENLVRYLSVRYSYAPWIIELWLKEFSPEFVEELLAAGNETPDVVARVNQLKTTREDLKKNLLEEGFTVRDGLLAQDALRVTGSEILSSRYYRNGMFSIQDESSMRAVEILDPQPGETIVDVCAAPGGKTIYMAERMLNRGTVLARDVYDRKLIQIDEEAKRVGARIIQTKAWDAVRTDNSIIGAADRVLADVPCSGLGVTRRKPEVKYKEISEKMRLFPQKQLDILMTAAKYVRSGGVLVYSTCTISPYENQNIIDEFLLRSNSFQVEETVQLMPNVDHVDGFFICRMRRG